MNLSTVKPDSLGVFAGALCLLHCIATPFLFIAVAGTSTHGVDAPNWWISLNYFFLVVSFFAVYRSVQTTSRGYMKPLFWASWIILALILINEQVHVIHLAEVFSYAAALLLVGLHLYNQKYCKCDNDHCCAETTAQSQVDSSSVPSSVPITLSDN